MQLLFWTDVIPLLSCIFLSFGHDRIAADVSICLLIYTTVTFLEAEGLEFVAASRSRLYLVFERGCQIFL